MVAPSKLFQPPLNCLHCSKLFHPGISCLSFFLNNIHSSAVSCAKYFLPLLIIPLVQKRKNLNRDLFLETIKFYLEAVGWSTMISSSSFFTVCLLRNILGSFFKHTTLFLPLALSTQYCWFIHPRLLKTFVTATSQAMLETVLRQLPCKLTHLLLHSPVVQTILFMFNSALILHYKRKNIYKDFWFIQPYEKVNEPTTKDQHIDVNKEEINNENKIANCGHKNSTCTKFILEGIKSYIFYGIPLDLFSMIKKKKAFHGNQNLMFRFLERFKQFKPEMTGFFISYVCLYRLSSCLLRKYYAHLSMDLQHILSAFTGGFSYLCLRNTNFLTLSMVICLQLLWLEFCKRVKTTHRNKRTNLVLWLVENAPISKIVLAFNASFLVHNYFLNDHEMNSLTQGFFDAFSGKKLKYIRKFLIENDFQTLVDMANNTKIKTFL